MIRRRRDVSGPPLSAIGQNGAFVQRASIAAAGRLTALSPQGVQGAWQEWFASEARFEQARQELLGLDELRAESTEVLIQGNP